MLDNSLHELKLETVIEGCQAESNRPRSQEAGYCFELFRRALEEQQSAAWAAIDNQYKNLILHWIYCCAPTLSRDEVEEIVPQTLPKFWRILHKSANPLAERFEHVGALLNYLKQCAISVLRDHERRTKRRQRLHVRLSAPDQTLLRQPETEQELLARIDREQLVALVRRWVETYVTDPQERRVLSLSFEVGLTPKQIAEQYTDEFGDVQTVRRIKERILKRAKRALGHQSQSQPSPSLNGPNHVNQHKFRGEAND